VTKLFFAGAEQPSHRNLMAECGVNTFGINITNINRLVKPGWDVTDHLPKDAQWIAYADEKSTWEQAEWLVEQEPFLVLGPLEWREHFLPGESFAPMYGEGVEPNVWPVVGLTDDVVKAHVTLRRLMTQYASSMLVAVTGANRGIERLDVVVTYAWTMAQRFGETHVWAGNKLHRYAGNRKAEVRPKHRADMERLGIDAAQVLADDPVETARLAIRSWQEWGARYGEPNNVVMLPTRPSANGNGTTPSPDHPSLSSQTEFSDQDGSGIRPQALALAGASGGNGRGPIERDQVMLPGLELVDKENIYIDGEGAEQKETTTTVAALGTSYRQCNTCYIAHNCPAMKPGASCAFKIPVEVRTKDQLQATMEAVVEMQTQRVAFARFAEQIDGQGVDAALSGEIDRLFAIMAKMKDILDDSDVFRFQMEAKAKGGVLSRLFGEGVGAAARALPIPVSSDEVMSRVDS
jgi:hypothetical protein